MTHHNIESDLMALHDRYDAEIHKVRERIKAMGDPGKKKIQLMEQLEKEHEDMKRMVNDFNSRDWKIATHESDKLYDIFDVINKALEHDELKGLKH